MSDDDVERKATERAKENAHKVAVRRMRMRWQREGYNPGEHMAGIGGAGDRDCLRQFSHAEYGGRDVSCRLAIMDIYEQLAQIATNERMA
jgi:hypothetical protein